MTGLLNSTTIHLSFGDALRTLFGRAVHIHTEIDIDQPVEVLATRQTVYVAPWFDRTETAMAGDPLPNPTTEPPCTTSLN